MQDVEGNMRSVDGNKQSAPHQPHSQMQLPIITSEITKNHASERHSNLIHLGKRNRANTRVRQEKLPTGYGCYVNENTGQTILNVSIITFYVILMKLCLIFYNSHTSIEFFLSAWNTVHANIARST